MFLGCLPFRRGRCPRPTEVPLGDIDPPSIGNLPYVDGPMWASAPTNSTEAPCHVVGRGVPQGHLFRYAPRAPSPRRRLTMAILMNRGGLRAGRPTNSIEGFLICCRGRCPHRPAVYRTAPWVDGGAHGPRPTNSIEGSLRFRRAGCTPRAFVTLRSTGTLTPPPSIGKLPYVARRGTRAPPYKSYRWLPVEHNCELPIEMYPPSI